MATDDDSNDIWESIGIAPNELPESARPKPRPLYAGEEASGVPADVDLSQFQEVTEETYEPEEAPVYEEQQPLTEVEKRLQKAVLYQRWAQGNLYQNQTECTVEVEQEFKEFALNQLNKLIGLPTATATVKDDTFDNNEVLILKALVRAIMENKDIRMSLLGGLSKPTKPEPKKQEKPAAPAKKPGRPPKASAAVVKPVSKPPAAAKPSQPAAKPVLMVQDVPQELQPVAPPVARPVQQAPRHVANPNKPVILPDGTEFEENGRKYRIKWVITTTGVLGPAKVNKLEKMPQKTAYKVDDVTLYKNESDEIYKILKQDITPKTTPANGVPFPTSNAAMLAVTLDRASTASRSGINVLTQKLGK